MKTNTAESTQRLHAALPVLTFCILLDYVDRLAKWYQQLAAKPTRISLLMSTTAKAVDVCQPPSPCTVRQALSSFHPSHFQEIMGEEEFEEWILSVLISKRHS